jgi:hypothetical protein
LGHQTKTHVNDILHKDINNKSKQQNYPNYQMQMMLLKYFVLYNNKKWLPITANITNWRAAQYRNW